VTIRIVAGRTGDDDMAKIETIRFNGRTTSEVRKQYRRWYEDNRAKVSIVNEHEIERLRLQTGGPQNRPLGREDAYTMLVEYEHKARAAPRSNPSTE
jgi:hypothetical protein